MAPPASAAPVRALSWLLFVGASVHVAATGWLYTLQEVRGHVLRNRARYLWVPASLILGTGFCVVYLTSLAFSFPVFAFSSPYAAVGGLTIAHGLHSTCSWSGP